MLKIFSKLAAGFTIAVLILLLLEAVLRVAGYRGPSEFEDPYLGFEAIYPLFGGKEEPDGSTIYSTNANKLRLFNRQEFRIPKPPGVFRIFCFGGSTTYGRPLKYQTAYPRWLEILLNSMDPTRRYEVINAGGISYASYRIVHLVREAMRYQPDLFIVYSGHNEFLERRTYGKILKRSPSLRALNRYLSRLRLYDAIRQVVYPIRKTYRPAEKSVLPGEVETILERSAGLDLYSRDLNQKPQTFAHYRENLTRMAEIARSGDVPILFVNLVSNIADFSPFKSERGTVSSPDEAMSWERHFAEGRRLVSRREFEGAYRELKAAYDIDPRYAELPFLLGRTALALGRISEAEGYFERARDEDVCPLRAPGEINAIITEVGDEEGVPVVDVRPTFRERNRELVGHPILGNALFFDHLHPTIEGHQLIANRLAATLVSLGQVRPSVDWDPEETRRRFDGVLNSLDDEYFAEGNLNLGKVLMWARKAQEALVPLRVAAERIPGNADAHYTLGTCLSRLGKSEEAIERFRKSLAIDPGNTRARNNLALELRKTGDLEGALREFREILALEPGNTKALNNMGMIFLSRGNLSEAGSSLRKVLEIDPENAEAHHNLGLVEMTRNDYPAAERELRRAIALRPNFKEALNNLAIVLLRGGRPAEARRVCEEALRTFPESPELHNNLGEILLVLKDVEGAREQFSIALSIRPGWPDALENLQKASPE